MRLRPARNHPGFWAFAAHRVSGVALALFLPVHFLLLGTALDGAAGLDSALALTENPLVKIAEWGLVVLLTAHLMAGLRVLVLEFLPWRDSMKRLIALGAAVAAVVGVIFLVQVG
ncbi:MAG: succinate dehydrogenase, cytochrome b556 subunit [Alphaproteobacteria bacterium]|nr:succinate dehydrogenase, cytochrome b556 subunit [Alphaproteobacteria bacterium]